MATSSPVPSTNSADTATTTTTTTNATATSTPAPTPAPAPAATNPTTTSMTTATTPTKTTLFALANPSPNSSSNGAPKSLRGLNKPKCSKCGNVARSRCPYQSCKSCCAKAQNPCHIHVLKANASFPDKAPASSSPLFDQKSTDVSPAGASLRVNSLRQLSQFNGTQVPFRARRPLTRKDAAALNQWRFSKLKEYKDSYIEAENEAFDRYMKNVSLLEEAFLVKNSYDAPSSEESAVPDSMSTHMEDNTRRMISGIKLQLRSNPKRAETFRKKIQEIVDQGLNKLCKLEADNDEVTIESNDLDDLKDPKPSKKAKIGCAEWVSALDDLTDKLNKARNEEDLQSCLQMKFQLFNKKGDCTTENKVVETVKEQNVSKPWQGPDHLLPRLCRKVEINQETLQIIEMQFASLDQADEIDDL